MIVPDWPAPPRVRALATIRSGGVSRGPFSSLNLGAHCGDDPGAVAANRRRVEDEIAAPIRWLDQVHGTTVIRADAADRVADAVVSHVSGEVCAVLTADCLPILLCAEDGSEVAAAHAGWRGLAAGIIEATVGELRTPAGQLLAWLGPAISARNFEVGPEVREAFVRGDPAAGAAFSSGRGDRYFADLPALARQRLARLGIDAVFGGTACTFAEDDRYFSYRRDGETGRQASLIVITG